MDCRLQCRPSLINGQMELMDIHDGILEVESVETFEVCLVL